MRSRDSDWCWQAERRPR